MKTLSTIIAAILMASTASAQVRRTFDVDKFDHININAPTEITITQGKKHEIKAEYNLPKGMELIVDTHMNILSIRMNNKQMSTTISSFTSQCPNSEFWIQKEQSISA